MYLAGLGTDQDYETAALWLERAAEKSHKYAQYTLAGLYAKGQGEERDLKRGRTDAWLPENPGGLFYFRTDNCGPVCIAGSILLLRSFSLLPQKSWAVTIFCRKYPGRREYGQKSVWMKWREKGSRMNQKK